LKLTIPPHSDGKSNGITMPEGEAHERLIRQAYSSINLDMASTAMIEAHGKTFPSSLIVPLI
jgi:acyl transferase domain-containing protein